MVQGEALKMRLERYFRRSRDFGEKNKIKINRIFDPINSKTIIRKIVRSKVYNI